MSALAASHPIQGLFAVTWILCASCGSSATSEEAPRDAGVDGASRGGARDAMGANTPEAMAQTPIDPCVEAGTCPFGVWEAVPLPGYADPDTVETVLVDPVRPSDFYAFVGSNNGPTIKVYRSTDFGLSWENRNTTVAITGNPWGASIDPNPHRDPTTVPTLWSPSGYGAFGAWKSVDGGATWTRSAGCDAAFGPYNPYGNTLTDLYHVAILPDDPPNHILATYHYAFKNVSDGGFGESWDGGLTWVVHPPPAGIGTSHYVMPIGATTWAVIAQDNNGKNGIWRTTTAGRTGGTAAAKYRDGTISTAAWTMVDTLEHVHGSHQNLVLADGTLFATGGTTGARSIDQGATWTHFTSGSWAAPHQFEGSDMSNLAVTGTYVYTNWLASPPTLARAPLADPIGPEKWDIAYCTTPAGMHEGGAPFGMASSYDPALGKWVIVAGTYHSGMWRYVEP
jgi:hypothetical protein